MQRTAECTIAARRTDMQNKAMWAEGSRPKSIKCKSTRAKWREIQEWQEQSPQAKEVGGSRMQGTGDRQRGQKSPEPKLS